jgi:hypothetical protein
MSPGFAARDRLTTFSNPRHERTKRKSAVLLVVGVVSVRYGFMMLKVCRFVLANAFWLRRFPVPNSVFLS